MEGPNRVRTSRDRGEQRQGTETTPGGRAMSTNLTIAAESAPDRLMTIDEVAEYTQIPKYTLYKLHSQRRGPLAAKLGRHLRYRRSDVDAWIASNVVY